MYERLGGASATVGLSGIPYVVGGQRSAGTWSDHVAYLPAAELPPMPGDANGDGVVDDLDLTALATHWEQYGGWADGDFSRDGFISDRDLTILAAAWPSGAGAPGDVSAVPGPTTATVLLAGCLGLVLRKRPPAGASR